jgi:hypothetical protein
MSTQQIDPASPPNGEIDAAWYSVLRSASTDLDAARATGKTDRPLANGGRVRLEIGPLDAVSGVAGLVLDAKQRSYGGHRGSLC